MALLTNMIVGIYFGNFNHMFEIAIESNEFEWNEFLHASILERNAPEITFLM